MTTQMPVSPSPAQMRAHLAAMRAELQKMDDRATRFDAVLSASATVVSELKAAIQNPISGPLRALLTAMLQHHTLIADYNQALREDMRESRSSLTVMISQFEQAINSAIVIPGTPRIG